MAFGIRQFLRLIRRAKMKIEQAIKIIQELQELLGLSFLETLESMRRNHDSITKKQGMAYMCFMANPL